MARSTLTVSDLAAEAGIDLDETLISLWDGGLDYVGGPRSVLRRGDTNRARRIVGLATRRELASRSTWQSLFELDDDEFENLLDTLGISVSEHRRFSQKAIKKLRTEAKARELSWPGTGVATNKDIARVESNSKRPVAAASPFRWKVIGQERDIKYLVADDVRAIHEELIREFASQSDPIDPPGVRDDNLLESALTRPHTSMGESRKYPSIEMSVAALLHSLIHNHPFHNGNKRTALVAMLAALDTNRMLVTCEEDELFKIVLRIAQHSIVPAKYDNVADREVLHIDNLFENQPLTEWIQGNSRRIELGDRAIPFRRLRTLVNGLDCICDNPKGSHISITRTIHEKRMFRKDREKKLSARAPYRSEGREIDGNVIARIRREIELDELHGIDSASFYDNAPAAAGDFIIRYRKTLRRLARL